MFSELDNVNGSSSSNLKYRLAHYQREIFIQRLIDYLIPSDQPLKYTYKQYYTDFVGYIYYLVIYRHIHMYICVCVCVCNNNFKRLWI